MLLPHYFCVTDPNGMVVVCHCQLTITALMQPSMLAQWLATAKT
jgi:hypothetical protein